jgi:hypothetical protein
MSFAPGHRIYLDDSGQKEYGPSTSRYFVYAGPMVALSEEHAIAERFSLLKESVFGTRDVEIKSNWIRIPKERRRRYLLPYGLSDNAIDGFMNEWYELMKMPDITYLAAVIDKPQMLARYPRAWYASATAYQFLLQRYELQLRRGGVGGHVTVDDMEGASPNANQWRALLKAEHTRLKKHGCNLTPMRFEHVSDTFLFGHSHKFELLQVADIVAYNVYRQFRDHGDEWDRADGHDVPLYHPLRMLLPRFATGDGGRLEGWGIVKWPSQRTKRWHVDFSK